MTDRKTALLFLLMLCIGVLPLQNLAVAGTDHAQEMLLDCVICDMEGGAERGSCNETQCIMATGFCGAQSITGFLSRLLPAPEPGHTLAGSRQSFKSHYRSYLDFSIYRPPIV
jgi:hypothetical protein